VTVTSFETIPEVALEDVPMAEDRGVGWAYLRALGPLARVHDVVLVTRREDVERILRDPELFSSQKAFDSLGSPLPLVPIAYDPPEHTRYRQILQPFFSPRALKEVLPSLQSQIAQLIDGIAGNERVEVMRELAVPYPSQVFLTLFGLPLEDRERLIAWKDEVIALSERGAATASPDELAPALELFAYLTEAIQEKRAAPGDDILSALLRGDTKDGIAPLDEGEALGLCFLFVLAGLDTVTAAIGFALQKLADDPALRRTVMRDESATLAFIEEIVRLEPPAPFLPRVTTEDVELAGYAIPAGTLLHASVGSANRDDGGDLADPDAVQTDEVAHRHWGFGGGPHRCLGSHLARLELRLVLREWHARLPDYAIAPGSTPRIAWPANTFGLESLELVLGAAAG
jgi:cytochrome P450